MNPSLQINARPPMGAMPALSQGMGSAAGPHSMGGGGGGMPMGSMGMPGMASMSNMGGMGGMGGMGSMNNMGMGSVGGMSGMGSMNGMGGAVGGMSSLSGMNGIGVGGVMGGPMPNSHAHAGHPGAGGLQHAGGGGGGPGHAGMGMNGLGMGPSAQSNVAGGGGLNSMYQPNQTQQHQQHPQHQAPHPAQHPQHPQHPHPTAQQQQQQQQQLAQQHLAAVMRNRMQHAQAQAAHQQQQQQQQQAQHTSGPGPGPGTAPPGGVGGGAGQGSSAISGSPFMPNSSNTHTPNNNNNNSSNNGPSQAQQQQQQQGGPGSNQPQPNAGLAMGAMGGMGGMSMPGQHQMHQQQGGMGGMGGVGGMNGVVGGPMAGMVPFPSAGGHSQGQPPQPPQSLQNPNQPQQINNANPLHGRGATPNNNPNPQLAGRPRVPSTNQQQASQPQQPNQGQTNLANAGMSSSGVGVGIGPGGPGGQMMGGVGVGAGMMGMPGGMRDGTANNSGNNFGQLNHFTPQQQQQFQQQQQGQQGQQPPHAQMRHGGMMPAGAMPVRHPLGAGGMGGMVNMGGMGGPGPQQGNPMAHQHPHGGRQTPSQVPQPGPGQPSQMQGDMMTMARERQQQQQQQQQMSGMGVGGIGNGIPRAGSAQSQSPQQQLMANLVPPSSLSQAHGLQPSQPHGHTLSGSAPFQNIGGIVGIGIPGGQQHGGGPQQSQLGPNAPLGGLNNANNPNIPHPHTHPGLGGLHQNGSNQQQQPPQQQQHQNQHPQHPSQQHPHPQQHPHQQNQQQHPQHPHGPQQPQQQQPHAAGSPSRPLSQAQSHTPALSGQSALNRPQSRTDASTLMSYSPNGQGLGQAFPGGFPSHARAPSNPQFPFNAPQAGSNASVARPPSTPGMNMAGSPHRIPATATGGNFMMTPAQQLDQMRSDGISGPGPGLAGWNHSPNIPRPPSGAQGSHAPNQPPALVNSQHSNLPSQPPPPYQALAHPHLSPMQTHLLQGLGHGQPPQGPQRPPSSQQPRPPSQPSLVQSQQPVPSMTARLSQFNAIPGQAPPGSVPPTAPSGLISHPPIIPPTRIPPNMMPNVPMAGHERPRVGPFIPSMVGIGPGMVRIQQFLGHLASEHAPRLQLSFWEDLVKEFFTPTALFKFTLWKDNAQLEAKPFSDISVPILPRFFLVTAQSGVKRMNISLDGARERLLGPNHHVVECETASWTYKYTNGYSIILRGPFTAHVVLTKTTPSNHPNSTATPTHPFSFKVDNLCFDSKEQEKYIDLQAIIGQRTLETPRTPRIRHPATPNSTPNMTGTPKEEDKRNEEPRIVIEKAIIPPEPVNAFSIPQATMRCLELAESVGQMNDLIEYSNLHGLGPRDALKSFATALKDAHIKSLPKSKQPKPDPPRPDPPAPNSNDGNAVSPSPAVTIYSVSPSSSETVAGSSTATQTPKLAASQTPGNNTNGGNEKPSPRVNTAQANQTSSVSTPISAGPSTASATPLMSHQTLKRKMGNDSAGPAAADAPAAKRQTRRRGRTGGG